MMQEWKAVPVTKSKAAKCVYQLQQADYEKLSKKFRNAHFISKHHKSFKDYELLCRLDRAKGL